MKIRVNKAIGGWEMAESDLDPSLSKARKNVKIPCDWTRILLVDDELTIRQVFGRVLGPALAGVTIEEAVTGADAVKLFKEKHHGLLVMDISMPIMTGDRAFLEIQRYCADAGWEMPSVVFCTGFDPPLGIRQVVAGDPAHCMLQKPVRNTILIEAVKSRLRKPEPDA